MLILTRRDGEDVVVRDGSGKALGRITVVDIRGDRVRLGFNFLAEVEVHRAEIDREIQSQIADGSRRQKGSGR